MVENTNNTNNILEICRLNKSFGNRKVVDDVSFQVKKGSFFALLGSNGAGKTTTLNIVLSLLKSDSGLVNFDGHRLNGQSITDFKKQIGVVFQGSVVDQNLTVMQNLEIAAALYHLNDQKQSAQIDKVIDILKIDDYLLHQKVKNLSGGERRRVDIARAIINDPQILFLDELTTGLDPSAQNIVWNLMKKLNQEHKITVIFVTHYLEESEQADQVVIFHRGRIVDNDTVINLKNKYHLNYIIITSPVNQEMEVLLVAEKIAFTYQKDCYHVYFKDETQLNFCLSKLNNFLKNFRIVQASMRDVFLHAVGEEIS